MPVNCEPPDWFSWNLVQTNLLGMDHYFSTGAVLIFVSQHTIFFSHSAASNNFFLPFNSCKQIFNKNIWWIFEQKVNNSFLCSSFGILVITWLTVKEKMTFDHCIFYKWQLACIKFQLNLWQNINEEFFKAEYLIKLSQYVRNLAKEVMRLCNKTFFSKASKVLADFNKIFQSLIYVLPKI